MFDWISGIIVRLGYPGVAMLMFLENAVPPIPSELVVPLAGVLAARGEMRVGLMIAAATAGSVAGALGWYVVGRRIGERRLRAWVARHGRWLAVGPSDLDAAQSWFRRYGYAAVFVGRLVPGVRTFVSVPAGLTRMPIAPFLVYSVLGTAIWTGVLAYLGILLQSNIAIVGDSINLVTNIVFAIAGLLLARRYVRCWRQSRGGAADRQI
jgi:membrane protein DedA with SNARE-associated domain